MSGENQVVEYDPSDLLTSIPAAPSETQEFEPQQLLEGLQTPSEPLFKTPSVKGALKTAEAIATKGTGTNLAKGAAALFDETIGNIIPAAEQLLGYPVIRPFVGPAKAKEISDKLVSYVDKPLGKFLGITEDPVYQNEGLGQIMKYIGKNLDKGAEYISEKTGMPKEDVQYFVNLATIPATEGGIRIAGAVKKLPKAMEDTQRAMGIEPKAKVTVKATPESYKDVGAAQTTNKSMLDAAIAQASPQLKEALKNIDPADPIFSPKALNHAMLADSLPEPVLLTKGQALQDPTLISRERNERGFKEPLVERFNQQNKALLKNAELMKDEAARDLVNTTSHVADSEGIIDQVKSIQKANHEATQSAYKSLEEANGGKFPVDAKTFGENARAALEVGDDTEFLPSSIKAKVDAYAKGKEMNFNQFENLRTQIARETRRAQAAQDGNAVNALSLVRQELENLPMPGASAELKQLADEARSRAKADFDLERDNDLYKKVVNESADTKDFIRKFVLDSKNADFANSIQLLQDNPVALAHLRSGTMDFINRNSLDASGNFASNNFAKYIENLDLNQKLDPLFGAEQAQKLRKIAEIARLVKAQPEGHFVSTANTVPGAMGIAKQMATTALERNIPGLKTAAEMYFNVKNAKDIKETLEPGAGVGKKKEKFRLNEIGKE